MLRTKGELLRDRAVSADQAEIFAGGAEAKVRVQLRARRPAVLAGSEHHEKLAWRKRRRREKPLRKVCRIIREAPVDDVHGEGTLVLQFDPVRVRPIRVHQADGVLRHEFGDEHGRLERGEVRRARHENVCGRGWIGHAVHRESVGGVFHQRADVEQDVRLRRVEGRADDVHAATRAVDGVVRRSRRTPCPDTLGEENLHQRQPQRSRAEQSRRLRIGNHGERGRDAGRAVGEIGYDVDGHDMEPGAIVAQRTAGDAIARVGRAGDEDVVPIPLIGRRRVTVDAHRERGGSEFQHALILRLVRDGDGSLHEAARRDDDGRQSRCLDQNVIHVEDSAIVKAAAGASRHDAGVTGARAAARSVVPLHLPVGGFGNGAIGRPDFSKDVVDRALGRHVRFLSEPQPVPDIRLPDEVQAWPPGPEVVEQCRVRTGLSLAVHVAERVVDALTGAGIDGHRHSAARVRASTKIPDPHTRQHFLDRTVVAGQPVEEVIRVAAGGSDMQHTVTHGIDIGTAHDPVGIGRRAIKIVLEAVHRGADLGGRERLRLQPIDEKRRQRNPNESPSGGRDTFHERAHPAPA